MKTDDIFTALIWLNLDYHVFWVVDSEITKQNSSKCVFVTTPTDLQFKFSKTQPYLPFLVIKVNFSLNLQIYSMNCKSCRNKKRRKNEVISFSEMLKHISQNHHIKFKSYY